MTHIKTRNVPPRVQWQLEQQGVHPLLARIYAARGIQTKSELDYELKSLIPPAQLAHETELRPEAVVAPHAAFALARLAVVFDDFIHTGLGGQHLGRPARRTGNHADPATRAGGRNGPQVGDMPDQITDTAAVVDDDSAGKGGHGAGTSGNRSGDKRRGRYFAGFDLETAVEPAAPAASPREALSCCCCTAADVRNTGALR